MELLNHSQTLTCTHWSLGIDKLFHPTLNRVCDYLSMLGLKLIDVNKWESSKFEGRFEWVRILHSAEEDNLSPFDSNIACLCQSIEINNNTHVYRQSQVRKPIGNEVEWAECLLIIGTGCRVQGFSLILDSSVGLSAGIQSAGE